MKNRLAIALTLVVMPMTLGARNEGHLLRPFVHKGDQWTTSTEFDLDLTLPAAPAAPPSEGGEKDPEKDKEKEKEKAEETSWKLQRRDRIDTEILEAKADLAAKVRRNFTKSHAKLRSKVGKAEAVEKQEDTALNQASLVLEKDGEATKLASGGGSLSADLKVSFEADELTSTFLPAEKTEEGKEWTIEGKRLAGFLTQQLASLKNHEAKDAGGKLKLSLKGVKEEKGKKSAEISIEGDLSFTLVAPKEAGSETHKLVWQAKGKLLFDPTTSRSTQFSIEGKVEETGGPAKGSARISLDVEDKETPTGAAIRLLARFHPGDAFTKTDLMKVDISLDELTMMMNGKKMDTPTPEQTFTISTKIKSSDEILEATEGKLKKLRREFHDVSFELKGPPSPPENPMEELEGKVIIVEEENGEVHAKPDTGVKVDEKLLKGQGLGDEFRIFLPEDEVKKGSSWAPDEKKLAEMFQRMLPSMDDEEGEGKAGEFIKAIMKKLSGSIDCKLAGLSEEEGTSVARISLKGALGLDVTQDDFPKEMRADMKGVEIEVSVSGKFEGEMLFDTKAGKPMKFAFAGPISVKVKIAQSNEEAGMDFQQIIRASGNLDMDSSYAKGKPGK